jgi:two-component system, chemotaxis family, protein-glutamate methylesterase/glutaminase
MSSNGRHIIVIGTSAGGLEALDEVMGQLPAGLAASIFIVQHMAAEATGEALLHRLGSHSLNCKLASDGESFKNGNVYIAPADYHLLVKKKRLLVTKGARENRYRPSIDPLFRSAAVAYGPGVIGVILTGMLDDGTAGLIAVKKCGGVTVVQDPKDAAYPEMPQSALNNLKIDHCVPLGEMGLLLEKLVQQPPGKSRPIPEDIRTEAEIAERVLSDIAQVNTLGSQVPYNCPNCGGVLWQMDNPDLKTFRCHTGHSFTAEALLDSQTEKIEETLWVALRMLEERKNLLNNMDQKELRASGKKNSYAERAKETDVHIGRVREMLLARGLQRKSANEPH